MGNSFDKFSDLPEVLQKEALREGEMLLQAQLTVASAADQRALTWGGLLLTGATASLGGAFALMFKTPPQPLITHSALLFAAELFIAAGLAISTVAPKLYCMPGNQPSSWLPDAWECKGDDEAKIAQARREQAAQLDKFIEENTAVARSRAGRMHWSFGMAFFALAHTWFSFIFYLMTS